MKKVSLFIRFCRKALRKYAKNHSNDFVFTGRQRTIIHVLGNGPSLDQSLYLIKDSDDVIMVNFSVTTDLFRKLKPKYLCFADPVYFESTGVDFLEYQKDAMFKVLNEIEWHLTIVLPVTISSRMFPINNENVTFQFLNTVPIDYSIKFMRHWLFKKNYSMPELQNVVIMGVYTALQIGHKKVFLHGVDSDSYKNICINQSNEMVTREYHYYGAKNRNLNQEKKVGFERGTLYKRLECEVTMFRSYVDLSNYADYLGIKVINASPNSMIDAFDRYEHKEQSSETESQLESTAEL